jgi:hypothetical protein
MIRITISSVGHAGTSGIRVNPNISEYTLLRYSSESCQDGSVQKLYDVRA